MTQATCVAVVQHNANTDVASNLDKLADLSRRARADGAQVICWPEAFAYLGRHEGKREILEPLPDGGPILDRCRSLAAELGCELLLGGFHEVMPSDPERCYNTSVYLDQKGEVRATYRKIHLFDVDIENGPSLRESRQTAPGNQVVTTDTLFGTLGLTVCYDLRFPALYQNLVDQGAIAVAVPSAFTATTGALHWHALLRARAIEAQCYVIAPAQHGWHSKHRASYGHSMIVDPWGQIVAEIEDGDGYALAEINPAEVERVRREIPSLDNRQLIFPPKKKRYHQSDSDLFKAWEEMVDCEREAYAKSCLDTV
ncbi:MAG: carbon-nitrogen hydrolase family protein [Sphingomonadales bacterium]|nr:carbon-nitrogen hydrolase family protein [Sphingomonadales bacterium]